MIGPALTEFIEMGGLALYVWGAYGLAIGAVAWEGVMLLHRHRCALDELRDPAALPSNPAGMPGRTIATGLD